MVTYVYKPVRAQTDITKQNIWYYESQSTLEKYCACQNMIKNSQQWVVHFTLKGLHCNIFDTNLWSFSSNLY